MSEKILTISVGNVMEVPIVTGPGSLIVNQSPSISWTPDAGATSYDIWFSNLTTGQVVRANTTNTSWTTDSAIGIGQYMFWVRGRTSSGSVSPWSLAVIFRVVTPVSLSPLDSRRNMLKPTVSWTALKGAATYEVWVSDVTNNIPSLIRESAGTAAPWTPSVNLPIGTYRVRVRGIDTNGVPASWLASAAFVVAAAPVATESLQSTFSRTPTFSWSVIPGAVSHNLSLRNSTTGETRTLTGITDTSWTPRSGTRRWQLDLAGSGNQPVWTAYVLEPIRSAIRRRSSGASGTIARQWCF